MRLILLQNINYTHPAPVLQMQEIIFCIQCIMLAVFCKGAIDAYRGH